MNTHTNSNHIDLKSEIVSVYSPSYCSYPISFKPQKKETRITYPIVLCLLYGVNFARNISFMLTYTVLTFGDAQGDDDENSLPHMDHGFHSKLPPGILPHGLPTVQEVAPAITPQEKKVKEDEKKPSKSLHLTNKLSIKSKQSC